MIGLAAAAGARRSVRRSASSSSVHMLLSVYLGAWGAGVDDEGGAGGDEGGTSTEQVTREGE